MNKYELTDLEKEMLNFNFNELESYAQSVKEGMPNAKSASEATGKLCELWKRIRKFVKAGELIPGVGRFIKLFADVLDSLCPQ